MGENLFLYCAGTLFKSKTRPFTFGSEDRIPQSKIVVLISNGLIYTVYIPLLENTVDGNFKSYSPPNISPAGPPLANPLCTTGDNTLPALISKTAVAELASLSAC